MLGLDSRIWKTCFIQTNSDQKSIQDGVTAVQQMLSWVGDVGSMFYHLDVLLFDEVLCPSQRFALVWNFFKVEVLELSWLYVVFEHFSPPFFQSCCFFLFLSYPEPHTFWALVSIQTDGYEKVVFFSLATAQSCGSLTVEHTEHLILAGSSF